MLHPLLELSQILNPGVPDEALPPIMAIGFYGDESESAGQVFTLAGFMATPSAWNLFVPRWRQMLCDTGPYPVDAFHAADIEAARPPFDGWPIEDRRRLVDTAIELLADETLCSNLGAFSCTFVVQELNAVAPSFVGRTVADLYEQCYRVLLRQVLTHGVQMGIDFVFDNKEKVKGRVEKHFNEVKTELDRDPVFAGKLNEILWRDDRKIIPLQAADLLAYEIRRHAWTRITKGAMPMRSAYSRIKESLAIKPAAPPYRERVFRCYDSRFMALLLAHADANPGMTASQLGDAWFDLDAPED